MKCFGDFGKVGFRQRRFGDPYIFSRFECIDPGEKKGTQKTPGTVAFDSISYFFPGDKTDTPCGVILAKKENEIGSMPRRSGLLVDRIKIARGAQAAEVF